MRFTFDQLNSFIAVAEEEHFGRAAERLHMTQPPLSRQVQTLERHLGVDLFDRSGRRTRLTPAGSAFLVDARRLIAVAAEAEDSVRRIGEGRSGLVRVGFTSVVGNATLPRLFRAAAINLPDVRIALHEVRTPSQVEALMSGQIDLALGRSIDPYDDLVSLPLPSDELVLVAPKGFFDEVGTRSSDAHLSLADLNGRDFVMYSGDAPRHVHDVVVSTLTTHGVRPRYAQHTMEVYMMLSFVDTGIGAAIVPRSTLNWAGRNTQIHELAELANVVTHSVAIWRASSLNPAVPQLLSALQSAQLDSAA